MRLLSLLACAAALALSACGGGGDDSDGNSPQPQHVTINGVAATGAALAGATVDVKCASGTAPATAVMTDANGNYSVTVTDGALPCVIRVTKDGESLHSIVEQGAELPATANVTPLTELLTALVSGGPASALYADFSSTAQEELTAGNVSSATLDLVASLAGIVDLSGDDLLKGNLVAAVDGEGGNLLDQKLDAIALALQESDTTLAELSTAVTAAPGEPPEALADVPTAAASCPALRSGPYFGIEPANPEFTLDDGPSVFDAATLTFTYQDEGGTETTTLTPVAGQPCRFVITDDAGIDGDEDLVVSRSGIGASRFPEDGGFKTSVFFPAQQLELAELAGDWNYVGYVQEASGFVPINGRVTFSATGEYSGIENYVGLMGPEPEPGTSFRLIANGDGTFAEQEDGVATGARYYAHRAPNGTLTVFISGIDGGLPGIAVMRKQQPLAVRPVGTTIDFWSVFSTASTVNPITDFALSVVATDTSGDFDTETRLREGDERVDTRSFDFPRVGLLHRAPNSCTTGVGGPPVNCPESISVGQYGTGFNAASGGSASNGFFEFSVNKP